MEAIGRGEKLTEDEGMFVEALFGQEPGERERRSLLEFDADAVRRGLAQIPLDPSAYAGTQASWARAARRPAQSLAGSSVSSICSTSSPVALSATPLATAASASTGFGLDEYPKARRSLAPRR